MYWLVLKTQSKRNLDLLFLTVSLLMVVGVGSYNHFMYIYDHYATGPTFLYALHLGCEIVLTILWTGIVLLGSGYKLLGRNPGFKSL